MSDYVKRLKAVVEAARRVADVDAVSDQLQPPGERSRAAAAVVQALAALDALPAQPQPQGETVTLAVWRNDKGGRYSWVEPNSSADLPSDEYTRLGTVTLPLDQEGGE